MEPKISDETGGTASVRPVIVAGKIYVRGADGFRAASTTGIPATSGSPHQPDGYYVRLASGVRLHGKDGLPFVFIKRERNSGFIVTCHETTDGIRYMFGASELDFRKLGLDRSAPMAQRLETELAERILWETSPEAGLTVTEWHQRMVAAEAEYERALDRVYGIKREADTRYRKHADPTLKAASQAFSEACVAWQTAYRFSQTPAQIQEALSAAQPSSGESQAMYLVARWDVTDTASFVTNGPRDELGMTLERLAADIEAREAGPAMYTPMTIVDTDGQPVGTATFTTSPPTEPSDGKPLLVIPVKDFVYAAIAMVDLYSKLQSSIEDIHLDNAVDHSRMAHFYWRALPALERQWHHAAGSTESSLQATHDRVRGQLVAQERRNPYARFVPAYEGIERAAESLGLQARLQGVGDSARVGYFKDGQWTGIETEITWGGKALTTVNGQRTQGTGYTAEGEWQRDQLECALNRLPEAFEARPPGDVYAEAADLYEPSIP